MGFGHRSRACPRSASKMPRSGKPDLGGLNPSYEGKRSRMAATLEVRDLVEAFTPAGRPAVDGVSFVVPAGEIVVLLGPSGCGKTTTLRCIAGLEHPTGGTIAIGGATVSAPARGVMVPPRLRNIGMVFQSYAVWPHMTVTQNIAYPLKHRKLARDEVARKVDDVLQLDRRC